MTGDEEFRYGAIGAGVLVILDLVFYALGGFRDSRIGRELVQSVLIGAVMGVAIARFQRWKRRTPTPGRDITRGVRSFIRDMGPGMLWFLVTVVLGMISLDQASERGDEFGMAWLVLLVLLAPVAAAAWWVWTVKMDIDFLRGDYGEKGGPEQRTIALVVLRIALAVELLMFLVWPANARINLIAVLLTAATMTYYFFKRDLWTD